MQNSLSRKSSTTWKQSTTFSPAEISQSQIINNMDNFKDFFCLQNCISRRSSIPRKYSNSFSIADMSESQIINNPRILKDFFACRVVFAADHRCPGNFQTLFHLQICLSRKSSITRKHSKTFSPAELSLPQIIDAPEVLKTFSPAEVSQPQMINNLEQVNDIFTGRIISVSKYQQHGIILFFFSPAKQSWPQSINNMEIFKDFFTCGFHLAALHQQRGNIQRLFRLQNSLRRRPSTTWKYSKIFPPANLSWPQIITIPKTFKDFFACRLVLAADHRYPGNNQKIFHLQNCLSRKSSIT